MSKPGRAVKWNNLSEWEPHLKPGVKVIRLGANNCLYDAILVDYSNGNMQLDENGIVSSPHYVEKLEQIETETEMIRIVRN